jgi:hypothetical protein
MSGFFTDPRALESQHKERAEIAARRRAKRHADERESARVAIRIRAAYEERLAQRPGYLATTSGYRPPYPWQAS